MSAEPVDLRRIDLDSHTTVWVAAKAASTPDGDEPSPPQARARVRPTAAGLGAVLAAIAIVRLGPTAEGLLAAWTLAVLTVLAAIDLEVRLLPNRIVFPATVAAFAWQATFFPGRLTECLIAGAGAGLFLLLPSIVQRGAVGMGDVKLAVFMGAVLGADVVAALLVGSVASVPVALAMLLMQGARARRATLPFGPFLALGAAVALLA